jgi:hypothetical protein
VAGFKSEVDLAGAAGADETGEGSNEKMYDDFSTTFHIVRRNQNSVGV